MDIEAHEKSLMRKTQLKVVALLASAAVLAVVFAYWLGAFGLGQTYELDLRYRFAGGIDKGSPVRLGGIRVGRVSEVKFVDDPEANIQVTVKISPPAFEQITSDSKFYINLAGLIGERYVEVVGGQAGPVKSGDRLRGIDPPRIDQLISQGYGFFEDLRAFFNENKDDFSDLVAAMNTLMSKDTSQSIVRVTRDFRKLSSELLLLTQRLNKGAVYLEENGVGSTYADMQSLLRKANMIHVNDIRRLMLTDGVKVNFGSQKVPATALQPEEEAVE